MDMGHALATGTTQRIAAFSSGLDWHALPADVQGRARSHFVDTLGAIIGGISGTVAGMVVGLVGATENGGGLAIPGSRLHATGGDFAMLCGSAAHGIELDDGYRQGSVHPGVSVVPALLAASGSARISGPRFLGGLVAGYEIVCALAEAGHPALRQRGYHPTSATGPIGAAVAVAHALGFDAARTETAIGVGASACGGLFAFLSGGADVKRVHGGFGARGGLEAARLAAAGIAAPQGVIEGPSGWAQAFTGVEIDPALPPQREFRLLDCYIKPHACCRHIQPAFECALDLMRQNGLRPEEVEAVDVETYTISAHHAGVGWGSFADAQLSFPYLMALAIHRGAAGLAEFDDETRAQPWVGAVAEKLTVTAASDLDRRYPEERPARVSLRTTRGTFSGERSEASGSRDFPLSQDELHAKFMGLAAPVLGDRRAQELFDAGISIDGGEDASAILAMACQSSAAAC
ncbi:MmgE/PrpD family protein [Mesorhizobium sp. CAU 1741]|uniref:MmgE/PrpD family protein n=1 Tax=Mesorhizobium sp. CAU 1741 TaxID=3140366 RepID=UPI00325B84D2